MPTGGTGGAGSGGAPGCVAGGSGGTGGSPGSIIGNWYSIGLANRDLGQSWVVSLAIDPADSNVLYASTAAAGVFKTTDGGASWLAASTGLASGSGPLVAHPANPNQLYTGSGAGIFETTDGGRAWLPGGLSNEIVLSLAVDPLRPTTLYAGTAERGIYKTTDGGASWAAINSGLAPRRINLLAVDPRSSDILYAGSDALEDGANGIWKSTNGGASWNPASVGLPGKNVGALAIDPVATCSLYVSLEGAGGAGGNGGIFRSADGAASFTSAYPSMSGTQALAINPRNPAIVYAGTDESGILVSQDRGVSWSTLNSGLPSDVSIMELQLDPNDPSIVFAATTNGVFRFSGSSP
jgi:photosystem II stability/assembly factor-like uncharacterized protein